MVVFIHSFNPATIELRNNPALKINYSLAIEYFISNGIARISVPIFFVISGYLFFLNFAGTKDDYFQKLRKRVKTLIIPYLFWSAFCLLVNFSLQSIPATRAFFSKGLVKDFGFPKTMYVLLLDPMAYQLWFLRDLIVIVFLTPIIYFLIKKAEKVFLLALFILWFLSFNFKFLTSEGVLFFTFGAILAQSGNYVAYYKTVTRSYTTPVVIWLAILILETLLFCMKLSNSMWGQSCHKIAIVTGILAFWNFYDKPEIERLINKEKLKKIATLSFFLYASHEPLLSIFQKILPKVLGKGNIATLITYFFCPIATIVICLSIGYFFRKKFTKLYEITTGGR